TGWMMWNFVVGGLLVGCTILLYDGSPAYPDMGRVWQFAQDSGMTFFGTSAGYLTSCMKAGIEPGQTYNLSRLRAIGSTGSPLPSMPLFFWNDPEGKRYQESYFEMYPGVWRHGDWIKITPTGSAIITGRSDSTINRMGVRMGSSEIYRVVEALPEVLDSLVV